MKKYYLLLLAVLGMAGLTACSEDEDFGLDRKSLIEVIESNVLFQASAGSGTVAFNADGLVSAKTDRDWCTADVNGNLVNVTVTENGSLEGRTSLLTLHCGTDSVQVTVQQNGLVFALDAGNEIVTDSDEAHSVSYKLTTNLAWNIETDGEWFSAAFDGENLVVTFTENTTGHVRMGNLKYSSDTFSGSIAVMQYDFEKDLAGPCFLVSYTSEGKQQVMRGVLSKTGLSLPDFEWNIPLEFEEEKSRFLMYNAGLMGKYQEYDVYTIVQGSGYLTWSSSVYMTLPIAYDADAGITYLDMIDAGTWSRPIDFLSFYAFNGAPASNTMVGYLSLLYSPSIWREDPK